MEEEGVWQHTVGFFFHDGVWSASRTSRQNFFPDLTSATRYCTPRKLHARPDRLQIGIGGHGDGRCTRLPPASLATPCPETDRSAPSPGAPLRGDHVPSLQSRAIPVSQLAMLSSLPGRQGNIKKRQVQPLYLFIISPLLDNPVKSPVIKRNAMPQENSQRMC